MFLVKRNIDMKRVMLLWFVCTVLVPGFPSAILSARSMRAAAEKEELNFRKWDKARKSNVADAQSPKELKNNELMQEMNYFFGGQGGGGAKFAPNSDPSEKMRKRVQSMMEKLDEDEVEFFRNTLSVLTFSVTLIAMWIAGFCCVCCCGYETILNTHLPCCARLCRAFCWPALCCSRSLLGVVRLLRSICGRCRAQWRRRPWKAEKVKGK